MPFIVEPDQYGLRLGAGDDFKTVLAAPDKAKLKSRPVSRALNNVKNEGPDLVAPIPIQEGLF